EPNVSQALNLLQQGASEVINGNLLTLPVGEGLLYVQPVYLQSSASGGGTQYPLLQMVLVSFGDKIGFAPTLDEALDLVFGGDSGAQAGDAEVTDPDGVAGTADTETGEGTVEGEGQEESTEEEPAEETPTEEAPAEDGTPQERLDQALTDLDHAVEDADAAMAEGVCTAYREAQDRIADALIRAASAYEALENQGGCPRATYERQSGPDDPSSGPLRHVHAGERMIDVSWHTFGATCLDAAVPSP